MAPATRSSALREAAAAGTDVPQHNIADPQQLNDAIRQRSTASKSSSRTTTESVRMLRTRYPDTPPKFIIDLSLPPEQRYLEVCAAFKQEVSGLASLFDEVVSGFLYRVPRKWVHFVCRTLLRKVHDKDESRELKGISEATGVPMYLLICFNVLLDLFMGCSSGGAAVQDEMKTKMLHFRTLDWGMPELRKVVVQLDFRTKTGGLIVASSLTYAGYVGVLTGVKKDLSISLNFRPYRVEKGQFGADATYYWHLLMVLVGRRRSISSEMRQLLLPREKKHRWRSDLPEEWSSQTYEDGLNLLAGSTNKKTMKTTACYLCLSNGQETTVIEKDYRTAIARCSREMLVVTNTDQNRPDSTGSENSTAPLNGAGRRQASDEEAGLGSNSAVQGDTARKSANSETHEETDFAGIAELLEEARLRQLCAEDNYRRLRTMKRGRGKEQARITEEDVIEMVQKYPTTNEETHFACVMDPQKGTISWCRRWVKPISKTWIQQHMSEYEGLT